MVDSVSNKLTTLDLLGFITSTVHYLSSQISANALDLIFYTSKAATSN